MSSPSNKRSLRDWALRGGGWTFAGFGCSLLIRLGGNLILTRLLVPEMFGMMAVVYVLMTGFVLLSDVGLNLNIVQSRRGEDPVFLNTAWIVQIFRGALIWFLAIMLAVLLPSLARLLSVRADSVYMDPMLPVVLATYGMTNFIMGFQSTKLALGQRQGNLARIIQIELIGQTVALLVMVSSAAMFRSIWALVAGAISAALVNVLLSHVWLAGPANRWHWDTVAFREIIGFGKWVFFSSILGFLASNGDPLLLGGMIDARSLGLYSIAFLISNVPLTLMNRLIVRVFFPLLSEVARDDPDKLRSVYYKCRFGFDAGMLFLAGALFMCGEAVIRLLYDSRYYGAGPILAVLALSLIAERYQLAAQCFVAMGKPEVLVRITLVRLISLCMLPVGFFLNQVEGVVWAIALRSFLALPVIFLLKKKFNLLEWKKELLVLPVVFLGAGAGSLVALLLDGI